MTKSCPLSLAASALAVLMTGCESIDASLFGGSFGRNSSAMTGGGAVAGQDYVIGLKPSEAAQQYFASASSSDAKTVTVTPGDDKGTGVTWTDDGGITIPPGVTIEFTNKGCCLDPHLPAPKADEEMQFIKTSCLIPTQLQGTYKNLLRRAAAGDEDVKSNLQHLMWTLRTAGSNDAYAKNLTDRQREILAECAEAGSFDGYCQDLQRFDGLKKLVMAQVNQVADQLQVEIGNVTYKVSDLLDPELGKQKVAAHLGELIHMNEYLPVVQSGFNFGELKKGIYTDIKGNGTLSFKAKVANSTSEPFVFYPMDYVAQVGSGQNMQGAFFAAADNSMKQRTTTGEQGKVGVSQQRLENPRAEDNLTTIDRAGLYTELSREEMIQLYVGGLLSESAYRNDDGTPKDIPSGFRAMTESEFRAYINNGWLRTRSFDNAGYLESDATGFAARLLINENNGTLTIAIRGTNLGESTDRHTDLRQWQGTIPAQYREASLLLGDLLKNSDASIRMDGHSLGGALVQYAMAENNLNGRVYGETYNSAQLSLEVLRTLNRDQVADATGRITNVRSSFDEVSGPLLGNGHIGTVVNVENGGLHPIGSLNDGMRRGMTGR